MMLCDVPLHPRTRSTKGPDCPNDIQKRLRSPRQHLDDRQHSINPLPKRPAIDQRTEFVRLVRIHELFRLVHRLGANFWVAASTGLLFYFSLSHFRAILWISGIGHLLASGFGLTSCLVLLRHVRVRRRGLLWISVAFFAAAAWAHQSAVVFLPLFFILLFQRDRSFPWRDLAPLCAVPIAVFLASKFLYATPLSDDGGYTAGLHLLSNPLNQLFRLFGGYFLDPTTASGARGSDYRMGLALILILGFIALRNRSIRLPALWTIVSLLPFSLWPAGSDNWRYYYLPSTGSSVLVALLFGWLGEHSGRLLRVPMLRHALPFVMTAAVAGVNLAHMPCLQAVQFSFSGQYFQRIKQNHRKDTGSVSQRSDSLRGSSLRSPMAIQHGYVQCSSGKQGSDQCSLSPGRRAGPRQRAVQPWGYVRQR